jgi:hypothetical protein
MLGCCFRPLLQCKYTTALHITIRKSGRECRDARVVLGLECKMFCTCKKMSCEQPTPYLSFSFSRSKILHLIAQSAHAHKSLGQGLAQSKIICIHAKSKIFAWFSECQSSVGAMGFQERLKTLLQSPRFGSQF